MSIPGVDLLLVLGRVVIYRRSLVMTLGFVTNSTNAEHSYYKLEEDSDAEIIIRHDENRLK